MCNRALATHLLQHACQKLSERVLGLLAVWRVLRLNLARKLISSGQDCRFCDVCRRLPVDLKRVSDVRAIGQIREIFPAEPQLHVVKELTVGNRDIILDQLLVTFSPGLLFGNEQRSEIVYRQARLDIFGEGLDKQKASSVCRSYRPIELGKAISERRSVHFLIPTAARWA